jgi:two-component system, OmpR family, alkaline phosphatase synthesis response regulator PhoP
MKKKVLVVDDERDIVDLLTYNLKKEGYDVLTAYNGQEALLKAASRPDLIVLDLMMPLLDGFETCKRLKADPSTLSIPVIFLTAKSGEIDEVVGFELGADDYIQKPISPRKFVARVKALLRRVESVAEETPSAERIIRADGLEINRSTFTVRLGKREIFFPKKEFELLALLAASPGRVYTREMLLNSIWGSDVVVVDRTIDVHIRKIREKLGDHAHLIETIKGVGYRFKD